MKLKKWLENWDMKKLKVKVPRSRAAGHLALKPKNTSKLKANPDYVRMSFSSQQQSCWVFQDALIKFPTKIKIHRKGDWYDELA